MAVTSELRLSVAELRANAGDKALLTGMVLKELSVLAVRMRMEVSMIYHLVDKAVERVQEELRKFSVDPDRPYPPPGKHEMVLHVALPEVGKLAQGVEWKEKIIV